MNTKNQLPSDIDYIGLFDNNTDTGEARFERCVPPFRHRTIHGRTSRFSTSSKRVFHSGNSSETR
ncbi:hypothetical protein DFY52_10195 [Escherichia coli]|nr:hypothetical protein [Escherichia coli]EFN7277224.1 hypothetical protein [Escherichia coli O7:H7]EFB1301362.1 hypothetical protein [Escherichia coli]EFB1322079.1 hypothetical protein [Escherichia coli]EFB1353871.1 hypothetical protein [Escherichia coli]